MNAYTILLIMIMCGIEVRANEFWPNVGSVLFTREDLNKQIWSKKDVALLSARRYFQKLIPPPSFITMENEFVDKMLAYFRDTYTAIKNVSPDQEVDKIMTTALSDTVGGYLKLCVLPVTKLSFYGGIASYDNAYKVFRFYSEIKKYLCTDGQNWRSPDQKMLNAIIVNVPKVVRRKKQMLNTHDTESNKDPCTSFNYFEKSPKGLVVPIPVVNWDDVSMFLPVQNESTFSLHSPKHCNTLENYYNKAKTCMNSKSEAVAADFDQKFQNWLSSDILPHLKDDRLYVALGNVLGLLNKTREMCDVILDVYNSSCKESPKAPPKTKKNSVLCSKTTIIVIIILVFEIIWCIVAIDRLCCKKTSDLDDSDDNSHRVLSYFRTCTDKERMQFKKRNKKEYEVNRKEISANKQSCIKKWPRYSNQTQMDHDIKCLPITAEAGCQKEPSIKYQCPSIGVGTKSGSQSSFRYQVRSSDVFTVVNERIKDFSPNLVPMKITNRSYTKIPSINCGIINCDPRESCTYLYDEPCSTVSRTKNKSAITIYRSHKNVEGSQAIYRTHQVRDLQIGKTVSESTRNEGVLELIPYSIPPVSCTCQNYADESDVSMDLVNIPSNKEASTDPLICYCSQEVPLTVTKKAKTISELQTVITRVDKETETNVQKKKNLMNKLMSSVAINMPKDKKGKQNQRKRYLEIKIDRPKTEIKLGISDEHESPRKGQSKIPTRKSAKHTQNNTIKRPIKVSTVLPEYVDKSINSVIQCIEQSTDYTLTQEYTMYQVSAEEDNSHVVNQTPQNHVKNYSALESTLLSTQDVTTISKSSNTDNRSITFKEENSAKINTDEQHLRNESDPSKITRYTTSVVVPFTNLNQDAKIDQDIIKMTDKERLIHTIYEHSKEALLSALITEEEKTVKQQMIRESCEIVMESTDGSETHETRNCILTNCHVKTKKKPDTALKLTKIKINPETSKITKHQKSNDPKKKFSKRDRTPKIVKTKIPKHNNGTPWIIQHPPEKSLFEWNTSVELAREQKCELNNKLAPITENVIEKSSIVMKKNDTYDTTPKGQEKDDSNHRTITSPIHKSKIPQLMRISDAHRAKTLNTEVRLNVSF